MTCHDLNPLAFQTLVGAWGGPPLQKSKPQCEDRGAEMRPEGNILRKLCLKSRPCIAL